MFHDVSADCLAALMVLDPVLEPQPEPFRMQPDVNLLVNYDEYVRFVSSLPYGSHYLYLPTDTLVSYVDNNEEEKLLKYFYIDMAFAVGKELSFASRVGRDATVIQHEFSGCTTTKSVRLTPDSINKLDLILSGKGFSVAKDLSPHNKKLWDYACKLFSDAITHPTRWAESLQTR